LPKQGDRAAIAGSGIIQHSKLISGRVWIRHYRPPEVEANATELAAYFSHARPPKAWDCPVVLRVLFVSKWLGGHGKKARARGWAWDSTVPDVDNRTKQLLDVLQNIGAITNDSRIVRVEATKIYGDGDSVYAWIGKAPNVRPDGWCLDGPTTLRRNNGERD